MTKRDRQSRSNAVITQDAVRQAVALHQAGQLAEAVHRYRQILETNPNQIEALFNLGMLEAQRGAYEEAILLMGRTVAVEPRSLDALIARGSLLANLNRYDEALADYDRVLALAPDNAPGWFNHGNLLRLLGRYEEALASYERSLSLAPADIEVLTNLGITLFDLGRYDEALKSYDNAITINSDFAEALNNRASLFLKMKRPAAALADCDRAIAIKPNYAEALNNRGSSLFELKRHQEALATFDRALALEPDFREVFNNRGNVLRELKRFNSALESFERALTIDPGFAEALNNRGLTLRDTRRFEESLASYDKALQIKPCSADFHNNRGFAFSDLKRYAEAVCSFERVVELAPDYDFAQGQLLHCKMLCCDWKGFDSLCELVRSSLQAGKKSVEPFAYQGVSESPQDLLRCAEIFAAEKFPEARPDFGGAKKRVKRKIRVGYLSGEFRDQATAILMAGLFELHDQSRFEIFGFDNGWNDHSQIRARIEHAFDEIVDITRFDDYKAASVIHEKEVDLLVNLNGYFGHGRPGVFSYKSSPVQINYLGFPGTLGASYIDYLIADQTLIPQTATRHYVEKIVYLPHSYQANDSKRRIAEKNFTRGEFGLPAKGIVYCCFNNNYKITPPIFECWMRILKGTEGSVLWLLEDNPAASANLRREAAQNGINSDRLIFASRMPLPEHLARHKLADLFLDTHPCNAHTTASDALWAGLPVLTLIGETFSSRVAASLLNSIQMPELIALTMQEYESLAIGLASDLDRLKSIRQKLRKNRDTTPLFDTRIFAKYIETAYAMMHERYQAGLAPDHIYVPISNSLNH